MRILSGIIMFSLLVMACETGQQEKETAVKQELKPVEHPVSAVCIWDGASVRTGPSAEAEWITSLSLGEQLTWLGIEKADSSKPERSYFKVMLSDSTTGWSSEYVITPGEPAVVVTKTPVFKRPDLITMTETTLKPMSFVAVTESNGEWVRIVGNQKKIKGWIKLNTVSLKDNDVAVGVLYTKLESIEDEQERHKKLQAIVNNPVFENSVFIDELKTQLRQN